MAAEPPVPEPLSSAIGHRLVVPECGSNGTCYLGEAASACMHMQHDCFFFFSFKLLFWGRRGRGGGGGVAT